MATVLKLHQAGRHDQVIALIEAALISGQPRGWMYQVLALTYKIQGRPAEDVERALLSDVDPNLEYSNVILTAAYLARFKDKAPALQMYRQASLQAPFRPEPYIMGLKVARELEDVDAIEWAVTGIFNYAWEGNYQRYQRSAESAARETLDRLKSAGQTEEAERFRAAFLDARIRDLVVELKWTGEGDVDLLVEEPGGTVCNYEVAHTANGGVHLQDGYGPKQENCYEKYVCVRALSGRYSIRIRHVWGKIVGGKAILKVTKHQGTTSESVKSFTVELSQKDQVVTILLENGRREAPDPKLEQSNRDVSLRLFRQMPSRLKPFIDQLTPQQYATLEEFQIGRQNLLARQIGVGAIGIQPIISVVNEGVTSGVSAVVSADRRYVRIGVSPVFNTIGEVFNFSVPVGSVGGN